MMKSIVIALALVLLVSGCSLNDSETSGNVDSNDETGLSPDLDDSSELEQDLNDLDDFDTSDLEF